MFCQSKNFDRFSDYCGISIVRDGLVSFPAKGKVGARCRCDYNAEQKSRKKFDRFLGSCGISIMKGEVVSSETKQK